MIVVTGAKSNVQIFVPKDNIACIRLITKPDDNDFYEGFPKVFTKISLRESVEDYKVYCLETPEEVATQLELS